MKMERAEEGRHPGAESADFGDPILILCLRIGLIQTLRPTLEDRWCLYFLGTDWILVSCLRYRRNLFLSDVY